MKTIFIKDDRLREILAYRNEKLVELLVSGKVKGSYTIKQSSKYFETKKYPFYAIYFGWDIIDHEDGWKLKKKVNVDELLKELKEEIKSCQEEDEFGYAKKSAYDVYASIIKRLEDKTS